MTNQLKTVLTLLALIFLSTNGYTRTTYIGYSGAPGSDGSCAATCHGSAGGTIEVSGFPSEYTPGQTYSIAVTHNGGNAIEQFNGSCRVGNGSVNAGVIESGTNTVTYSTTGETNGVHFTSTDQDSGTFDWTAPSSQTGNVKLYVAGLQGNKSGPNTQLILESSELVTDVREDGSPGVPKYYKLSNNFPNPFNPTTSIGFDLPRRSRVTIEIFNLLGQRIARLTDEEYPAGSHRVTWNGTSSDGQSVPTGIYLYRLEAGDFIETKKMVLLK